MSILLSCRAISKSFSTRPLFNEITIGLSQGERLGLIGPNGSGKSTLLKILAGLEKPDSGDVSKRRETRLVYLPQEDTFPADSTIDNVLDLALHDQPLEDYERVALKSSTLAKVGFTQSDSRIETLSGGWKKRLAIALALVQRPDLLLMDEPTNHLDLQGVLWLEKLLKNAPFAYLLVSHDRYFLENVTNRIIELNKAYPEGYLSVAGTYSDFLTKKEEFLNAQAHLQHAMEGRVKREIEWLRRGPQARTTKAEYRIKDAGRQIEELADIKYRNAQNRAVEIDFTATNRKTRELLVAHNIEKSLGGRTLFSGLSFVLSPGVKLGLLGPNGSGKTTILRLLTGEITPDSGTIKRADGLRVVLFDQNRAPLEKQIPLRRALSPNGDTVIYQDSPMHISSWAKRFLFRPDQLDMPVGSLSGGEQARILIAKLMLQPADLLILDEPTNDLDIASLEVLEESLADFPGALVLVTHDRYMLDRISSDLLALDGRGGTAFFADYAQWEQTQQAQEEEKARLEKAVVTSPKKSSASMTGLTAQERRELNQMEAMITAAEEEVAARQKTLEDPKVASDHAKLQAAWADVQAAQDKVTRLYTRWEELEAKRDST